MIDDRHPELQSKWDKLFWARGYYVETIGNITEEAVQKNQEKKIREVPLYSGPVIVLATPSCGVSSKNSPLEGTS